MSRASLQKQSYHEASMSSAGANAAAAAAAGGGGGGGRCAWSVVKHAAATEEADEVTFEAPCIIESPRPGLSEARF